MGVRVIGEQLCFGRLLEYHILPVVARLCPGFTAGRPTPIAVSSNPEYYLVTSCNSFVAFPCSCSRIRLIAFHEPIPPERYWVGPLERMLDPYIRSTQFGYMCLIFRLGVYTLPELWAMRWVIHKF